MFGFWYVIEKDDTSTTKHTKYICRCAKCGKIKSVLAMTLKNGKSTSCGCGNAEHLKNVDKNISKRIKTLKKYYVGGTDLRKQHDRPTKNSSTGIKGVYFDSRTNKYIAKIGFKNQRYYLGCFDSIYEAKQIVSAKRKELYDSLILSWIENN